MAMTGIEVAPEVLETFKQVKTDHTKGYMILSIVKDKVVVEECGEPFVQNTGPIEKNKQAYLDLTTKIIEKKEPKYIIFDFHHIKKNGQRREKVVFISWCPDEAGTKPKMMYSGTYGSLKMKLSCDFYIQANDEDELSYEEIADTIEKKG